MNAHMSYAMIAILVGVGTVVAVPAMAQTLDIREQAEMMALNDIPITITTDKATYNHDSVIQVKGTVANTITGAQVTLKVTSPSNNIVDIRQLDVTNDGTFSTTLSTAGNLWKYDGVYSIKVQYSSQGISNKALIELTDGVERQQQRPVDVSCRDSELTVAGSCIPYSITGGSITSASATGEGGITTMSIGISSADGGSLTLEPFVSGCTEQGGPLVYLDGEQYDDYTISGSSIDIMFPAGTENIEVIGACVVPEFGTIAMLILAVAIVSIIAVTARSRPGLLPRF